MTGRIRRLAARGVLVAALVAALVERGTLGVILGLSASAVLLVVVLMEVRRSQSSFGRIRRALQHAQLWTALAVADESEGWDPYADDRITGLWNGRRVLISASSMGAQIALPLAHWPVGLAAERRSGQGGVTTGDHGFDQVVRVDGDDAGWRSTLGPEPRRRLTALCVRASVAVRDRALEIQLDDADIEHLEGVLDLAVEFSSALLPPAAEPFARVFELAAAEPISGVRALHFRWLVEQGWNAPAVFRAAAADPDPAIAAWGASQLAPADGVFR